MTGGAGRGGCRLAARGAPQPPTGGLAGHPRELGPRRDLEEVIGELRRQAAVVGIVAYVACRIGAPDRVGLAQEPVREPHVAIRVRAAELGQGLAGAASDLVLGDLEEGTDVAVRLAPAEHELEQGPLVCGERHGRKPTVWSTAATHESLLGRRSRGYVHGVLDGLASAAWKRPWTLLGAAAVLLASLLALAAGALGELGHSASEQPETGGPDLVLATRAAQEATPQVYEVALDAIEANLRSDPGVADLRVRGPVDAGRASIEVALAAPDAGEREETAGRLETRIDPGPLEVLPGGRIAELAEAEDAVLEDLWRLELLALPLAALLLAGGLGAWLAAGALASAAIGVGGSLATLRVAGALGDPSALATVPAAVVGVAAGIELAALAAARWRDEERLGSPEEALRSTVAEAATPMALAVLVALLAPAGLVASSYEPAASLAAACGLAAAWALAGCALVMPALFALGADSRPADERSSGIAAAARLASVPAAIARNRLRTIAAGALAVSLCVAVAVPAFDAHSDTLGPGDLAADSAPAQAAQIAASLPGPNLGPATSASESLLGSLPLAAALAAALLGAVLVVRSGTAWTLPLALSPPLATAAAAGASVALAGEDGRVFAGAMAAALSAVAAISAARTITAVEAVAFEREVDRRPGGVAGRAGARTLPACALATAIAGVGVAVLAGIELRAADQFAVAVVAGLVVDLVVIRPAALALLARLPGREGSRPSAGRRLRLAGWTRMSGRRHGRTGSPS
jgi:hypothetical protein